MWDIEKRIRRLEDRADLNDMVVRYFLAVDDDDYLALAGIFAEASEFSASGFPGASGREAIVESLRASRRHMGATVHTPDYALFDFQSDDSATGTVGAHLELAIAGRTLMGAVRYRDAYARIDGGWRIVRRHMRVVHMGPWEEIGASLTTELRVRWPGMAPLPSDFPKRVD
ncbi:nuclear transport factor 2 family protein [Pseudoduganella namucuonensis]|uniref:SnoaL-like domain-containing protein n=1 Tax=Pseudoduganella namucuonensis TaxID=1035707 RepID=A0A1I7KZA8_9BURK|nr:nuclear transport factor 2 family protein [Pseudoduganella namucuonensis]SFV02718.1 SnoaL-like domain-containing protein [Pseudoduganella namucuonensis]